MTSRRSYAQLERTQRPISQWALWFAVLGPAIIWAAHLNVGYVLIGLECYWSFMSFSLFGLSGLRVVMIGITVLAAAGIILGAVVGFLNWRAVTGEHTQERDPAGGYRFLTISGLVMAGFFFLYTLWSAVPIILTEQC